MRYGTMFGFVAATCMCLSGFAQDKDAKAPAGGMDEAAMMKAWEESAKTGAHHKALEPMVGKFKFTNKFRMDPAQEWMTSEGDYNGNMVMDGRFLVTEVSGPMMGMPFTGMGCLGYDNVLQKHVAAWIDNMGTGIMRSEGTCTPDGKTITFEGEIVDPMTRKPTKYKYVYEIKSADEFTMRWFGPDMKDGKMFESMVIEYKRAK